MNFLLSDELAEFSTIISKFFDNSFPPEKLKKRLDQDLKSSFKKEDEICWKKLAELGVLGAAIPEEYGGLGFGTLAAQIVLERSAQVLAPIPLFETLALGIVPLMLLGSEKKKQELLEKISNGSICLSGAFQDSFNHGSECLATLNKSAKSETANYNLQGVLNLVPALENVDALLIPAQIASGKGSKKAQRALFLLDLKSSVKESLEIETQSTFDLLRSYAKLRLKNTPCVLISEESISEQHWFQLKRMISLLSVSELIGVGKRVIEMTLDYVKTRTQFGHPIGGFQAIQHKLADMYVKVESAHALSRFAAWCADSDPSQLPESAAAAKAYASELIPEVIESAIQAHGGIGFTFEYDLHFYLRRAQVISVCFGSSEDWYKSLGEINLATK